MAARRAVDGGRHVSRARERAAEAGPRVPRALRRPRRTLGDGDEVRRWPNGMEELRERRCRRAVRRRHQHRRSLRRHEHLLPTDQQGRTAERRRPWPAARVDRRSHDLEYRRREQPYKIGSVLAPVAGPWRRLSPHVVAARRGRCARLSAGRSQSARHAEEHRGHMVRVVLARPRHPARGVAVKPLLLCVLAVATVATTACHRPDDYLLSPTLADEVLSVTLSATSMPADGISRTTVTAQIDPRTDYDKRTVTFATTAGTLIADGQQGTTISVTADSSGKAVVELRSSTTATTARIDVSVAAILRTASVQFVQLMRD